MQGNGGYAISGSLTEFIRWVAEDPSARTRVTYVSTAERARLLVAWGAPKGVLHRIGTWEASPAREAAEELEQSADVVEEVSVLRAIDFIHQGRRYRAKVDPVPGGAPEFDLGAWFVSMNDGPVRRVFEAHSDDADTPEFRHRIVIATWLTEGYNRRVSGERRKQGARDPSVPDRRTGL